MLVDAGYSGAPFARKVKAILGAKVEVAKRSELHEFVVMPTCWVVEQSFAWGMQKALEKLRTQIAHKFAIRCLGIP